MHVRMTKYSTEGQNFNILLAGPVLLAPSFPPPAASPDESPLSPQGNFFETLTPVLLPSFNVC